MNQNILFPDVQTWHAEQGQVEFPAQQAGALSPASFLNSGWKQPSVTAWMMKRQFWRFLPTAVLIWKILLKVPLRTKTSIPKAVLRSVSGFLQGSHSSG